MKGDIMPEETEKILEQIESDGNEEVTSVEIQQEQPFKPHYSPYGKVQDHKCLLCEPNTFHCGGSIASHLNSKHQTGREQGINYVLIDDKGNVIENKPRKVYGSGTKPLYSYNDPVKCLLDNCQWTGTQQNVFHHLKHTHNQGCKKGINYIVTGKSEIPVKERKQPQVQLDIKSSMSINELQMPLTITIPIIIGKIRIE
jgi:hypothetical protein